MSALLSSFAATLQDEEDAALTTQSDLAFTPRQSLWEHVLSLLQPAEHNEAKLMIGPSLILDNQQLHSEVCSLIDIVTCLQTAAAATAAHHSDRSPHQFASSSSFSGSSLFLPNVIPPLRLRGFEADRTAHLKDEIAQLIAAIRDKARQRGDSDTARIWTPRSDRERSIVEMVEKEKESARTSRSSSSNSSRSSRCSTARPSTAASSPSTARSASSTSISASRPTSSSVSSALSSAMASLSSLSISTLDTAVTRIQAALQAEREELLQDIDYLRSMIEEEEEQQADERRREELERQVSVVAPSEMELRALNKQLKMAVAEEEKAERTRRLLGNLPNKAPFRAVRAPLPPLDPTTCVAVRTTATQSASDGCPAVVQSDESVHSMLSSLDDMEAAFFHHNDPQHPTAASAPSQPTSPTSSATRPTTPSPRSPIPSRTTSSVFTIRPSSSSSSSNASAYIAPFPRVTSSLHRKSKNVLFSPASRRMLSRRIAMVDT